MTLDDIVSLRDFEAMARTRMPQPAFDYVQGGAGDELTLRDNTAAFDRRRLRPRVLRDVSSIDTTVELLGSRVSLPIGLAPVALQRLAHPDAELASSRAAAAANVLFCLSTWSSCTLEEVATGSDGPRWFQLYTTPDRDETCELVQRAARSGYRAVVVTVDFPVPGRRDRDRRNRFRPSHPFGNASHRDTLDAELHAFMAASCNPGLTWDDIGWIRAVSGLPVVLKGILTAEDAALAVDHGVSGIVVSNHGGRQLDRSPAGADVLEGIVDVVAGRAQVYLDGGIRRGTDVLVALALGADAVFVGRPYLFALAAGGQAGVALALRILRDELENAMALLGAARLSDVGPNHLL